MLKFKSDEENKFVHMFRDARPDFQRIQEKELNQVRTEAQLIKRYCSTPGFLDVFFQPFLMSLGYTVVQAASLGNRVLANVEPWRFLFGAFACQVRHRNIKKEDFSPKKNAGSFDNQQALYLAACDCFVTNDQAQYMSLRLVARLGHRKRKVLRYRDFMSDPLRC